MLQSFVSLEVVANAEQPFLATQAQMKLSLQSTHEAIT